MCVCFSRQISQNLIVVYLKKTLSHKLTKKKRMFRVEALKNRIKKSSLLRARAQRSNAFKEEEGHEHTEQDDKNSSESEDKQFFNTGSLVYPLFFAGAILFLPAALIYQYTTKKKANERQSLRMFLESGGMLDAKTKRRLQKTKKRDLLLTMEVDESEDIPSLFTVSR